jgi:hypothetical protein
MIIYTPTVFWATPPQKQSRKRPNKHMASAFDRTRDLSEESLSLTRQLVQKQQERAQRTASMSWYQICCTSQTDSDDDSLLPESTPRRT